MERWQNYNNFKNAIGIKLKTIWITGGSTGIGYATAKKFIEENWTVVISSSNSKKLENAKNNLIKLKKKTKIYSIKCDISNRDEVHNVVKKIENDISPIDIALLNAAAYSPNKTQKFDINNYEKLIDVNLKGTLYCIEILDTIMSAKNNGHIAIVASPTGYRGLPTAGAYGSTKAALINLSETLYFDFRKKGIKISLINPGFIKSSDFAAKKIFKGLTKKKNFEIYFPWFFLILLKFLKILPYRIYFFLIRKITGL